MCTPESFPRGVYCIFLYIHIYLYKGSELAKSFIVFYCTAVFRRFFIYFFPSRAAHPPTAATLIIMTIRSNTRICHCYVIHFSPSKRYNVHIVVKSPLSYLYCTKRVLYSCTPAQNVVMTCVWAVRGRNIFKTRGEGVNFWEQKKNCCYCFAVFRGIVWERLAKITQSYTRRGCARNRPFKIIN